MVERSQKSGERLAGAGRSDDQRVSPRSDGRPAKPLRGRRLSELLAKPRRNRRMKPVENVVVAIPWPVHRFVRNSREKSTPTDNIVNSILARRTSYRKPFSVQKSICVPSAAKAS